MIWPVACNSHWWRSVCVGGCYLVEKWQCYFAVQFTYCCSQCQIAERQKYPLERNNEPPNLTSIWQLQLFFIWVRCKPSLRIICNLKIYELCIKWQLIPVESCWYGCRSYKLYDASSNVCYELVEVLDSYHETKLIVVLGQRYKMLMYHSGFRKNIKLNMVTLHIVFLLF